MKSEQRFAGLDSIRAVAAIWVAMAHGGAFPLRETLLALQVPATLLPASLNGLAFNSTAAVTVFFVISGFCIHWPYVGGQSLRFWPYLTRRLVRVGLPLLVVLAVVSELGGLFEGKSRAVLWTVYCELVYYALYPLLLLLARRVGMGRVFAGSLVLAAGIVLLNLKATHLNAFSLWLIALVCLPLWLAGCMLAQRVRTAKAAAEAEKTIWIWRVCIWAFSVLALLLVFHSPIMIGYPVTMPVLALLSMVWLAKEMDRYRTRKPPALLEKAGAMSYSIYLTHMIAFAALAPIDWGGQFILEWLAKLGAVAALSIVFFLLVERPAHALARALSGRIHSWSPLPT